MTQRQTDFAATLTGLSPLLYIVPGTQAQALGSAAWLGCLAAIPPLAVLGWLFAPAVVRVFRSDDAEVVRIGAEVLRYQCLSFPLTGMVVMSNMYLQNIRRTVPAVIMATARQGLFFIPALFIGRALWGFLGVEIAQAVSDLLAFILSIPLTLTALRTMDRG